MKGMTMNKTAIGDIDRMNLVHVKCSCGAETEITGDHAINIIGIQFRCPPPCGKLTNVPDSMPTDIDPTMVWSTDE